MKPRLIRTTLFLVSGAVLWVFGGEEMADIVVWDQSAQVNVGVGYHDNVLRSSIAPEGSGYVRSSADASLIRLTSADRLFVLFLLGEDTRYFEGPVNYEQFISATAQYSSPAGGRSEFGADLDYLYQHQIFDASETEADLYRILVLGHRLAMNSHWQYALNPEWSAKVAGSVIRQLYDGDLDDFREESGRLSIVRAYGYRSEASLGYRLAWRYYDSRNRFDRIGVALPGTSLFYTQQEVSGEWKHRFDEAGKWRFSSKAGYMCNVDNGSGYFDYDRVLFRQQLRWNSGAWDIKATARYGWYRYAVQQVGSVRRERWYAAVSMRTERRIGTHWRIYAVAEQERDESNDPRDNYDDWYVETGLGYEF